MSDRPPEHINLEGEALYEMLTLGDDDPEMNHHRADEILCKVLLALGFSELVKEFQGLTKWYA